MIFLVLCGAGCSQAEDPITIPLGGTEGSGIVVPPIDLPAEGEPDVPLPTGECIQFTEPGAFGYWHQCEGEIQVDFAATYNNKVYASGDLLRFGPGASNPDYWSDPDSYDLPLVAACCGPFDYANPTTEQKVPYVNNCLFDAVQQLCIGMPHFLRKQAEETSVGDGKAALQWLADKIEDNTADCFWTLWGEGAPGPTGQNFNELNGASWSPPNTAATITITRTEVYDWTEVGDVPELTPCYGMFDNDAAVVPTAPINVPGVVGGASSILGQDSSAMAHGPFLAQAAFTITASGSGSKVVYDPSGAPIVTQLTLEAAPSLATIDGERGQIEHARLSLAQPLVPAMVSGEHVVAPGDAHFIAAIGVAGESRIVSMSNADPIVFREQSGGWSFDPFDLVYAEIGVGEWTLSLDGLDFVPRSVR